MLSFMIVCGNKKDDISKKRVDRAIDHFKEKSKLNWTFIFSGKGISDESLFMKSYAIEQNIDENIIITENESMNTFENLIFSKGIIEKYLASLTVPFYDVHIVICSSKFHINRIKLYSKDIFKNYLNIKYIFSDDDELLDNIHETYNNEKECIKYYYVR